MESLERSLLDTYGLQDYNINITSVIFIQSEVNHEALALDF